MDVAAVSWVVPKVQMWGATHAIGTQLHGRQATAQDKGPPAITGMIRAATVMAATAADARMQPEVLARAKDGPARPVGREGYLSPLPDDEEAPFPQMPTP